ncbi:MAG TPA: DUF5615 family PIN-like protein [Oscillatoriaceae cyanobacterium M33_DOE_052]|uniref:DUF5615 domain-containing protein n=1 Tax=Planktothricoides sp. SpSt-374 TaxID=2282167 RepID=A0A7C3VUM6_9CYAN|nr:DUF5615 family PIN-like protein [Oscillatoriaceae cyanobacterium M33_DOE_052]
MLILLDENLLSKKLKQPFIDAGHSVSNVSDMGWRGFKDREIMALAKSHPFDAFITADKNLPYQQNLTSLGMKIVVLDSISTRPDRLVPLMKQASDILAELPAGAVVRIDEALNVVAINP